MQRRARSNLTCMSWESLSSRAVLQMLSLGARTPQHLHSPLTEHKHVFHASRGSGIANVTVV